MLPSVIVSALPLNLAAMVWWNASRGRPYSPATKPSATMLRDLAALVARSESSRIGRP